MKYSLYWNYFIRLVRAKRRTLLTISGLVLSVMMINGVLLASYTFIEKQFSNYASYKEKNMVLLQGDTSLTLIPKLRKMKKVNVFFEQYQVQSCCIAKTDILVNKVVVEDTNRLTNLPDKFVEKIRYSSKLLYGTYFSQSKQKNEVIIDEYLSQRLFGKTDSVGQTFCIPSNSSCNLNEDSVTIQKYEKLTVVGVVKGAKERKRLGQEEDNEVTYNIYLPWRPEIKLDKNFEFQIVVEGKELGYQKVSDMILSCLFEENMQDKYMMWNYDTLTYSIRENVTYYNSIISKIDMALLIVNVLYIMTIILFSIKERVSEIGIRKSIGASNLDILEQFILEGAFYGIVAGIVGGVLVEIIVLVIQYVSDIIIYQNATIYLGTVGISLLTGVVSSVFPAYYACSIKIADAMKNEN